jgi:hypothetical protein
MTVPSPLIRNKRVVSRRTASPAPGRHDDRRAGDDDDNDDEQMDMGRHHDDVARARGSDGTPAPRSPTTDKLVNKTSPVSLSRATGGTASTVRATGNAAKPTPQTSFERGYRVDAAEDDEDDEMEDVEDVGDAEDAEDVASPAEDVTMRRTDGDVVKRDRRSERQREPDREEEEEEEDQRPSLPGIKQLFGIAGGGEFGAQKRSPQTFPPTHLTIVSAGSTQRAPPTTQAALPRLHFPAYPPYTTLSCPDPPYHPTCPVVSPA